MFNPLKRKNEDKAKGRPTPLLWVTAALAVFIVLCGAAIVFLVRPNASADQPTGHIYYSRDNIPMALDLQTGERAPYQPTPDPAWNPDNGDKWATSPDGQWRMQWVHEEPERTTYQLFIINTKSKRSHAYGPIYAYNIGALWSPDSQSLIFAAFPEAFTSENFSEHNAELWRVDIPTQQLIRLTNNTYNDHSMSISPDSTKLAYIAVPDGYSRLHIMDLTTGQSIMPAPQMFVFFFAWSPDSQWVAFETNHANGLSDIWITRADGSEQQGIAIDPQAWEREPIWQP